MEGGLAELGHRRHAHPGAARRRRASRSTRRARRAGWGSTWSAASQRPPEGTDAETIADEVEGFVSGLLGLVGIEADPLSSREHILLANIVQQSWANGQDLDLRRPRGPGAGAAAAQARRVRARRVLPARRPHQAGPAAQRPARLARVRGLGPGRPARHRRPPRAGRQAGLRHRLAGPPGRRGAAVRRHARAVEARHLDAPPARHRPAPRARVLRRGGRLRAADRGAAGEGADPHASSSRRGRSASGWCSPRRTRSTSTTRRCRNAGHLDDRPAADRAGQGAAARRPRRRRPAASTPRR